MAILYAGREDWVTSATFRGKWKQFNIGFSTDLCAISL